MNKTSTETRSVVVEREIAFPPEKIWRALTQPHLIEEWLMKNDFKPVVGHRFNLRGDWGGVLDCEVLAVEPNKTLSYTWNYAHDDAAYDLKSVVTFTLTPTRTETHLRMEQVGLPAGSEAGLRRRQSGVAAVLCQAGAGLGAGRLRQVTDLLHVSKEVTLNWNKWVRQIHRWLSMAFTVAVVANFVAMALGEPPAWVVYSPLPPALPAFVYRPVYVRAAACHPLAQHAAHRRIGVA